MGCELKFRVSRFVFRVSRFGPKALTGERASVFRVARFALFVSGEVTRLTFRVDGCIRIGSLVFRFHFSRLGCCVEYLNNDYVSKFEIKEKF